MAYQFIKENRGRCTVKEMAKLFGVSGSAYCKWAKHGVSNIRQQADAEMPRLIRQIVTKHRRRHGSPRVREELRRVYGKRASLKKVARLMRERRLNARVRRSFVRTTRSNRGLPACENLLARDFHAEQRGQKWVSDITYLRAAGGWVYLTAVTDLFDRRVIGWALSAGMETEHTAMPALHMAFKSRAPQAGLLFHSDRGVQYCAKSFRDRLAKLCPNVRQSMSRKGNCWDNACAETFFKTLETELETLDGRHSAAEVRQSVFMYIEACYNRVRMHSALGFLAPNMFDLNSAA